MNYKKELSELLKKNWRELTYVGDQIELSNGEEVTVVSVESKGSGRWVKHKEVVAEMPDGSYLAWSFEEGLTEMQDSTGPAEYGDVQFEDRVKETEVITVVKYVKPS